SHPQALRRIGSTAPATLPSFEQAGDALDQRGLVDRAAVADDLDLESADDVADEPDLMHGAAGRHQWRRHRQEYVAGADRSDDILGEGGDRVRHAPALVGDAAVLALRDNDLRAYHVVLNEPACDLADIGDAIAHREAGLGRVDADIVGARVFGDEVV